MFSDLGLLALRVIPAAMLCFGHGLKKAAEFSTLSQTFPDPLGVGSTFSLILTLFGEVFCPCLVMLGIGTRLFSAPTFLMMLVIAFSVHAGDPWSKQEFALLYAIPFFVLVLTGGGRFALDPYLRKR